MNADRLAVVGLITVLALAAHGQPATSPEPAPPGGAESPLSSSQAATEDAAETYWLKVTGDRVNLRSRPDTNCVVVDRLDAGTVLQARGAEFGWHAVVPPEGTFCYVSGEFIDKRSDTEGVVSVRAGNLRVRVGSLVQTIDPNSADVLALLPRGTRVEVLGSSGDWVRIAPPADVMFYIFGEHAVRISAEEAEELRRLNADAPAEATEPEAADEGTPEEAAANEQPTTTQPTAAAQADNEPAAAAPTRPGVVVISRTTPWGRRLAAVEEAIEQEQTRPPLDQNWETTLIRLMPIARQQDEPGVARVAAAWYEQLAERQLSQRRLRLARAIVARDKVEQMRLRIELERIEAARAQLRDARYAARGELLESTLPRADDAPAYKLRDPIGGAVVAYLRFVPGSGVTPRDRVGQYVGVRGEKEDNAALGAPVVTVQELETLNRPATEVLESR